LYKILFAINFIENTYKFYNFVRSDYSRRNYLSIKIFRKNSRNFFFLTNLFNKFARKISCNMKIYSSDWIWDYFQLIDKIYFLIWDIYEIKFFHGNQNIIIIKRKKHCPLFTFGLSKALFVVDSNSNTC